MDKIRVGINGFGTIGRRIAYAVQRQPDMQLAGVAKLNPDYRAFEAVARDIPLYSVNGSTGFEKAGIHTAGNVREMLHQCDMVIDCAPKRVGKENAELYGEFPGLKVIYQGGESADIASMSFNAQCNYEQAKNKDAVRVVSCNTTALCRVLNQFSMLSPIKKARVALVRRVADPDDVKKGPVNAWLPTQEFPSHHAKDVGTVLPGMRLAALAGIAPMTLMHGHMLFVEPEQPYEKEKVIAALARNPRLWMISAEQNIESTSQIKDLAHSIRLLGDVYEACIWRESVGVDEDGEIGLHMAVDQQAIVVPENIDAVRAMFGTMSAQESMQTTEATLGMGGRIAKSAVSPLLARISGEAWSGALHRTVAGV